MLTELAAGLPGVLEIRGDGEVSGICIDSRRAKPGDLFVCLPGEKADSVAFIGDALTRGAVGAVASGASLAVNGLLVEDTVDACWRLSKRVYGDPSMRMKVIGVTGTNGKTTVAWVLAQLMNALGAKSGYLGTLGARIGDQATATDHTTPFSPDTNELLKTAADAGVQVMAMEVSSHALSQRRVDGVEFDVGVFTNLSQDHLDFHADLEEYFLAKQRLFVGLPTSKPIITVANSDDVYGVRLLQDAGDPISFGSDGDLRLVSSHVELDSLSFVAEYCGEEAVFKAGLGARFNVSNCLAAAAAALALGYPLDKVAAAFEKVQPAPGRFEAVSSGAGFKVLVDYAHTPDALEKLLSSVRELSPERILTVFGCGGDRDRTKRPKMAAAASMLSDIVFVTSDNPRTEEPSAIIAEILPGIAPGTVVRIEPDRAKAIRLAIAEAGPEDAVVIAGKGHEDYQIIGTEKTPFDDRVVAQMALTERAACA